MVKVLKATFGDEYGSTDVMKTLNDKVKDDGIDIYVDSSIIPMIDTVSGAKTTRLDDDEKREVNTLAENICGPSDQVCLEIKRGEIADSLLKKKEATKTTSTAQIIKGRRLTVEYLDANGERRKAIVPEGQQFQVGKLGKEEAVAPVETETPAWQKIFSSWWTILGTFILTFLYAVSIIITWMTFVRYGSKILAAGMVAVSVFIPYSGFGLAFFGPFIAEYFRVDKMARLKAVVPEELAAAAVSPLANLSKLGKGVIPTAADPLVRDPPRK
jgi:hypothetical protein